MNMLWYIKMSNHAEYSGGDFGIGATKRGTIKRVEIPVKSYTQFSSFLQTVWLMEKNNQVEYTREKA
jgi:hypothetical protein